MIAGAASSRGRALGRRSAGRRLRFIDWPWRRRRNPAIEEQFRGAFRVEGDRLFFTAGDGASLEVTELQVEGKRRMAAADLLRGHGVSDGDRLGS